LFAAVGTTAAGAATQQQQQVTHSRHVVQFFRTHRWLRAPEQPNCQTIPWTRSCKIARRVFTKHSERIAEYDRQFAIPYTGNWTRAMRVVQKPFPGTYDFLAFTSNRECRRCYTVTYHVMNTEGSGAGGPMQFMESTFDSNMPNARAWIERHGYVVDPRVWRWTSYLGQALVAGYMKFTDQEGCHWCP
jgi:hypothetical protein